MGTVYQAFDTTLRRPAALKVLGPYVLANAEAMKRFLGEARSASQLNHPNVVTIYEVGSIDASGGGHYIAMELIEGESLRAILERGRPGEQQAAEWIAQAADGIAAAHAAGITHRDLKPENIVVARSGFAKILDFGLAKPREAETLDAHRSTVVRTTPGIVLGTVGYMSPEQARGQQVDHRTDIFALGSILYECLAGRAPFEADSALDTMHQILYAEPPPPDASPELVRIIGKCLAKDPGERYQSAKELAAELRAAHTRPAPRRRPPALLFALGTLALIAVAIVAAIVFTRRPSPPKLPMSITRITSSGNVIGAAISPDGEYVAYAYSDSGLHSIWLRQIATGSTVQIVPPGHHGLIGAKFTPDGRAIVYTAGLYGGGVLYELPILGGTPRQLLSNIASAVTFSPDGKRIAFHRIDTPRRGDSAIVIADADGSGERTLIARSQPEALAPHVFGAPEWSPDGTSIANALRTPTGVKLVTIDVAGGEVRALTGEVAAIGSLAWLPDDHGIVATVSERAGSAPQLWLIDPKGGTHRPITNDLFEYRTVTATRDGLALLAVAADAYGRVWRAGADGAAEKITTGRSDGVGGLAVTNDGTPIYTAVENGRWQLWRGSRQLTSGNVSAVAPALSPDGRLIVFTMLRERGAVLARMDASDGSHVREICPVVPDPIPQPPAISPDGRAVIFGSEWRLWKVPIEGGKPVRITDFDADRPAISPDGTRLAFRMRRGFGVMPLGGPAHHIDGVQHIDGVTLQSFAFAVWSADGKALIHNAGVNERTNVWLQPLDGSPPRKLTRFDDEYVLRLARSPDGKQLVVARGVLSRDAVLIKNFY